MPALRRPQLLDTCRPRPLLRRAFFALRIVLASVCPELLDELSVGASATVSDLLGILERPFMPLVVMRRTVQVWLDTLPVDSPVKECGDCVSRFLYPCDTVQPAPKPKPASPDEAPVFKTLSPLSCAASGRFLAWLDEALDQCARAATEAMAQPVSLAFSREVQAAVPFVWTLPS